MCISMEISYNTKGGGGGGGKIMCKACKYVHPSVIEPQVCLTSHTNTRLSFRFFHKGGGAKGLSEYFQGGKTLGTHLHFDF